MDDLLPMLGGYFTLLITAITVENAVLSRALGVSRLISLIGDITDTVVFGTLLIFTTVLSSVGYYYAHRVIDGHQWEDYLRAPAVVAAMLLSFMVVFVLAVKLMPYELVGKAAAAMPSAAFNSTVFGTVVLSRSSGLTLPETVIFGVGSGIGFMLAVLLVTEGQRKLQNRDIPAAFKGLPATLLYLAGLAVAVYGLTGYTFSL